MEIPDTLVFIHSSMGPVLAGGIAPFPNNSAVEVDVADLRPHAGEMISIPASGFLFKRMSKALRGKMGVAVLTNDQALATEWSGGFAISHETGKAATGLANFLKTRPQNKYLVRLLGNHPLTDPALVEETVARFKALDESSQLAQRFGPNVCVFGQNIEVFRCESFLKAYEEVYASGEANKISNMEEHVTQPIPPGGWTTVNEETAEAMHAAQFYPYISPFPGFIQERSAQNVRSLINAGREKDLPLTFDNIWQGWQELSLNLGGWKNAKGYWSDPEFVATSFSQLREAMVRGVTTIEGPQTAMPGDLG